MTTRKAKPNKDKRHEKPVRYAAPADKQQNAGTLLGAGGVPSTSGRNSSASSEATRNAERLL